ncbi:MAG: InlB B-repeat-containing protein [Spirochaetaceae bacterium]|nr:InlB B-repeat-containing protein [Spirochaetaceae bacterium]
MSSGRIQLFGKSYPPPPPPNKRIVVLSGKFLFFFSLLCIPLFFSACSNPSGSGSGPGTSAYTVIFKSNYETNDTLYTKTVTPPATSIGAADFPANPERSGYAFTGWNTASNGGGSPFTASSAVSADITVYAQWTAVLPGSYTVSFALNDGTAAVYATKTVTAPATAIGTTDFPGNPERAGYAFAGWNTAPSGSGTAFTAASAVSAAITVYAQWTAVPPGSYAVIFTLNDLTATNHTVRTVTPPAETVAANFPASPERAGYNFTGWNTAPNGSGDSFTAASAVTGNITVYAQWTIVSYTITYNLNGGTNNAANPPSYTIESPGITLAAPDRTGYGFGGWYDNASFTGSALTEIPSGSTGKKTFYAQWTALTYTITYTLYGGINNGANPASYTVEDAEITLAAPVRAGYGFGGWYTNDSFSTPVTVIPSGSTGDKTFYAKWNPEGSVYITLQAVPGDPPLSNVSVFTDQPALFSAAGEYTSWQWYWDGTPISGATTAAYTLAANSKPAGIHEVSVVVSAAGGVKLSARCRLTINAR